MDSHRQQWNKGHQELRLALAGHDPQKAVDIFLRQHAMLHAQKISGTGLWSFEDEVLDGLPDEHFRCLPPQEEHSIAWMIFHIARIEDITMNLLVAGTPQLFHKDGWTTKLNVAIPHSANSMDERSIAFLSAQLDLKALRRYRQAVGRRTREIIKKLRPEALNQKASEADLQKVMDQEALLPDALGILGYWSRRTIAGLILMPATRHNFLHLNEALRIKERLARSK